MAQFIGRFVIITATLLSTQVSSAAHVKPVRRVLIFHELGLSSPAETLLDQTIVAELQSSPFQIELYREYLEANLFPSPSEQQEIRSSILHRYRDRKLDLIIALGMHALDFVVDVHERAFKDVPVVFGGALVDRADSVKLDSHYTGIWESFEPEKTLQVALRLQPGTRHVVVVGGKNAFDLELEAWFHERLRRFQGSLDITYVTDVPMPQLLDTLSRLPSKTVVLVTHIGLDAAGTNFIGASQADPMVVKASNAPVFGPSDVDLGHGEVGGYLDSFALEGRNIGQMATRILGGESPKHIPVVKGANVYMFDWQALRRWGLSERDLPPKSMVLNRQPTLWKAYKWYIVGGLCLIVLQAMLIGELVGQRRRLIRTEKQLASAFKSAQESERRFRLVANTAPVMIWMSGPDKQFNYFNQPWFDFTGRPFVAEARDGWIRNVHPEDLQRLLDTYAEFFEQRKPFTIQYRLRRKDNLFRWILNTGVPRFNSDGSFAGFIGSCIDITDRKLAEEALSSLSHKLIDAQEQERTRIARELHDDINQRIAMLSVDLDIFEHNLADSEAGSRTLLCGVRSRVTELGAEIQAIAHRLHSSKLEYLGLVPACRSFCKEVADHQRVSVNFVSQDVPANLPPDVSLCLFRVLQEALSNAIKHSGGNRFEAQLLGVSGEIQLTVRDDGIGFDPISTLNSAGLGLISMRERVYFVSGTMTINSQPLIGTEITVHVPLTTREVSAVASDAA